MILPYSFWSINNRLYANVKKQVAINKKRLLNVASEVRSARRADVLVFITTINLGRYFLKIGQLLLNHGQGQLDRQFHLSLEVGLFLSLK